MFQNPTPYPRRGEVFAAERDKRRPVVILSINELNQYSPDVCVVPISSREKNKKFPLRVHIKAGDGGLHVDCWAKCDRVTTIEKTLLYYPPFGTLAGHTLAQIEAKVKIALGLNFDVAAMLTK